MLDLHNHILPKLDDGSSDWQQSLEMARIALEDGIRGVVCTPHYLPGMFENSRSHVLGVFDEFRRKLRENDIPLEIFPGAELRLDTRMAERIGSGELLSINDTGNSALVELPSQTVLQNLENVLWDLQARGITTVLAHPERIHCFISEPMRLYRLVEMGILLQMTSTSLLGGFGSKVKKFSTWLLEHRMIHVLASDAHGTRARKPQLSAAYALVKKMLGQTIADQMVRGVPEQIIAGGNVMLPYEPISISRKRFFSIPFWQKRAVNG